MLLLLRLPRPSSFWLFIWGWIYSVSLEALVGTSFWLPSRLLLSWGQLIDDVGFILWLCIIYSHWGIFPPSSEILICYWAVWLSSFMVIEMFGWFWQTLYCTSDIHTGAYSPLLDEIVFGQRYEDGWSLLVCLPHDFDIRYPYWGIFPSPLRDLFGQWYEDRWLVTIV